MGNTITNADRIIIHLNGHGYNVLNTICYKHSIYVHDEKNSRNIIQSRIGNFSDCLDVLNFFPNLAITIYDQLNPQNVIELPNLASLNYKEDSNGLVTISI